MILSISKVTLTNDLMITCYSNVSLESFETYFPVEVEEYAVCLNPENRR